MLCQLCATNNPDDADFCRSCGQKLLVISGEPAMEDPAAFEGNPEEQVSFDEHLLERISIVEEVVRRTAETVRQTLGTLYKLEQKILVNETGLSALRDLLEADRVIDRQAWSELWEARMDQQLLALEKRERFGTAKERIAELYSGDRRDAFRDLLDQAGYALADLDIDGAMVILDEAHGLDPSNHELAFFLGETCFNEGRTEEALTYFTRALTAKPGHFESLVYAGTLCHVEGRDERAEELLKRAVALYPDSFLPAFSLGAVEASGGHLQQAVVYLERALESGESLPQASYLLGSCYFEMGKLSPAIRHLREAVHQDPAFEEAHHLLGLAYLDRRWTKKALAAFESAQRLRPNRLGYHELVELLGLPEELQLPGLPEEAARWLHQAEESLRSGRGRQALSAYRQAVGLDPGNAALLVGYAMACLELQRTDEVEPTVDRVLEMEPSEHLRATAYAILIESLRAEGRLRESDRLGQHLLEGSEGAFALTVAYFELASNLAEMEEDLDRALEYARRSVDLAPSTLERFPLATLGWVHYKRRELPDAVRCLERSNDLGSSPRTLLHLGLALLASGEAAPAREALGRARGPMSGAGLESGRGGLQATVLQALQAGARLLQEAPLPEPLSRDPRDSPR
ncbi:MAG: tetratricopeptide repeat protein [Holophagales bacterium]|nr:tetratricopeptide repeat protein [Holophagales bacterium]